MRTVEPAERDLALRDDIRMLGRILGDTVRAQQGEAAFATVEHIRQVSIQFRRDHDEAARSELEAILDSLTRERTIEVVRAFAHFSHLANIAEDLHNIRSMRADQALMVGAAPDGTIVRALARAKVAKVPRRSEERRVGKEWRSGWAGDR